MFFVIEHLEPKLSEWLFIEYSHAAKIVGNERLLITNVKKARELRKLNKIARVDHGRVHEIFKQRELIVLDPQARRGLSPTDFSGKRAVVVGGILGDDPPLGRTRELLTQFLPGALARNLGKGQLAIDGAVYVAKQVSDGKSLKEVSVQLGLEIKLSKTRSTFLPYAFPLVKGKPLISGRLITYLKRH